MIKIVSLDLLKNNKVLLDISKYTIDLYLAYL